MAEGGDDDGDLVLVEQRVEVLHPVHVEGAVKDQQTLAISWAGGEFPVLILFAICFGFGHDDTTVKPKASRNKAILPPSVRRSGLAEQLAPLGFHHKDGILSIGVKKMTETKNLSCGDLPPKPLG